MESNLKNKIKLGICPTMEKYARELVENNKQISIINLGSAANVLSYLSNGVIDVGLIGRKAKKLEFEGFFEELNNKKGYTLISDQKGFILENNLNNLKISTNIDIKIIKKFFPQFKNINFVNNIENLDGVKLISWDDWKDEYELLIPIDSLNNKLIEFRKPYLFSKNKNLIDKILNGNV